MTKTKKEKKAKYYIEVQQAIDDQWYFSLCLTKRKQLVMMSVGYPTLEECWKTLNHLRNKKNLDPTLSVVTITHVKMVREMREDLSQS